MNIATTIAALTDTATRHAVIETIREMGYETWGDFASYCDSKTKRAAKARLELADDTDLITVYWDEEINRKIIWQACPTDELQAWIKDNIDDLDSLLDGLLDGAPDQDDEPAEEQAEEIEITEPINAHTAKPYSGKNVGILMGAQEEGGYPTSAWCTFKQALDMGRVVCKGQKASARIIKVVVRKDKKTGKDKRVVKSYSVFNLAQTRELTDEDRAKAAAAKADKIPTEQEIREGHGAA